mmetsp:Transcript_8691/g.22489  ORF Transcript_8691/g.22489 Transcript_8691/m.22489 type:complete len:204 (-) Transcript_8691:222-833(-)
MLVKLFDGLLPPLLAHLHKSVRQLQHRLFVQLELDLHFLKKLPVRGIPLEGPLLHLLQLHHELSRGHLRHAKGVVQGIDIPLERGGPLPQLGIEEYPELVVNAESSAQLGDARHGYRATQTANLANHGERLWHDCQRPLAGWGSCRLHKRRTRARDLRSWNRNLRPWFRRLQPWNRNLRPWNHRLRPWNRRLRPWSRQGGTWR